MTYYCSVADVADRMSLTSQERLSATSKITSSIRRATIEIDQEFYDRGRSEPSKSISDTTTSSDVSAGNTTAGLSNADNFTLSGKGNIDGDSFSWTGKDGGVSLLTIANAGNNYSSGTLSATGGVGSGFAGTYTVTANGGVTNATLNAGGTGYSSSTTYSTTSSGDGTGLTVEVLVDTGVITGLDSVISAGSGYVVGEVVTLTGGGNNGKLTVQAINSTTGKITATSITSSGIYTTSPATLTISDSGDGNASITLLFKFNRLTGCTGISFDHSSGVAVQEGEIAHILREICADIATGFIYEDQAVFGERDMKANTFHQRGAAALEKIARLGGIS